MKKIILASASPRRRELLESINLQFTVIPSDYVEEQDLDLIPEEYVKYLSLKKAKQVLTKHEGIIISADTVVVISNQIIGKPKNNTHAFEILSKLSGNKHSVYTGFSIVYEDKIITEAVETKVHFHKISKSEIQQYILSGEPMDKAGAYAIQGIGKRFIKKIEGSYSNVVGLPLVPIINHLRKIGIKINSSEALTK